MIRTWKKNCERKKKWNIENNLDLKNTISSLFCFEMKFILISWRCVKIVQNLFESLFFNYILLTSNIQFLAKSIAWDWRIQAIGFVDFVDSVYWGNKFNEVPCLKMFSLSFPRPSHWIEVFRQSISPSQALVLTKKTMM